MKIKSVNAWLQQLPLTKPYTIAYKVIEDTEIVFLEVVLENGITGIGASNPFEDVVGETPRKTLTNLQTDFVQRFTGRDIRFFNQLIDEAIKEFPSMPGTIAAIDIALHDAFCQLLGIRVVDLYGCKINALPTSYTIGIKDTTAMLEEAKTIYAAGFRVIKIKTGMNVDEDIERITLLAEQYKNKLHIRADANQGYSLQQLKYFLNKTKDLSIELTEQPLPSGREHELSVLPEADRKTLTADESLTNAASAMQLSHPPAPYGIFNIKLMKCGGIRAAREIAGIAANSGINLFWGCNDESIVSITAALHAAYSCGHTKYLDLDGSFDLTGDYVTGGFILKNGFMHLTDQPGLGISKLGLQ